MSTPPGKRIKKLNSQVDRNKVYSFEEACKMVASHATCKFDETVEIALKLGVDPRKAEQAVRGSVALPHGLGKTIKLAVFAKGDKAKEAEQAGADIVGAEDLVEKIKGGFMEFDNVVATPDMMVQVGKVGKLLGPRGLMPSPKVGTVTFDIAEAVRSIKAGRAEYKVEKAGIIHAPVAKASFGAQKIKENAEALLHQIAKSKPSTSKGVFLQAGTISLTMGPGVKFDLSEFRS